MENNGNSRLMVFVAEDDEIIRKGYKRTLEREGYSVRDFPNGEEAFHAIKTEIPHMVITDGEMPKMDGWTLIKKIKEEFKNIQTILISGRECPKDCPTDKYLGKPLDFDHFLTTIKELFKIWN